MSLGEEIIKEGKWDGRQLQFRCIRLVKYGTFVSYTIFSVSRKRQVSDRGCPSIGSCATWENISLAIENRD